MGVPMYRNQSVNLHQFSMIPKAEIPRSSFRMQKSIKDTFDAGQLVPLIVEEVMPGDTFHCKATLFVRMATPLYPVMDNLFLDTFFFFVPNRLVWEHWQNFMGEQTPNPDSSTDYEVPQIVSPPGGYAVGSMADHFGLPTIGQTQGGLTFSVSALPFRAYNLIYQEWFRDENLQNAPVLQIDDGPDPNGQYPILMRGKRHDYFTSCLPFTQKGDPVGLSLSGNIPVIANAAQPFPQFAFGSSTGVDGGSGPIMVNGSGTDPFGLSVSDLPTPAASTQVYWDSVNANSTGLVADLADATLIQINAIRFAFQTQKLLERDARGGTRYTEIIRSHFGVLSPDARLQRPEYLGGGTTPITVNPIAQTTPAYAGGPESTTGTLGALGTGLAHGHGFSQSFVEHGYVIGLVNVRADLTYQQGVRRHFSRLTRYDYFWPVFSMLGEQAVLSQEIYCDGSAGDRGVFGYQERWAEYRYNPSEIRGQFRSTVADPIDVWHYAQKFSTRPTLGGTFIEDLASQAGVARATAVDTSAGGWQFLMDAFIDIKAARPMPLYSVPGLVDHF